jgi:hypothetical protein
MIHVFNTRKVRLNASASELVALKANRLNLERLVVIPVFVTLSPNTSAIDALKGIRTRKESDSHCIRGQHPSFAVVVLFVCGVSVGVTTSAHALFAVLAVGVSVSEVFGADDAIREFTGGLSIGALLAAGSTIFFVKLAHEVRST